MSINNYRDFIIFVEEAHDSGKDPQGRPMKYLLRIFDSPVGEGEIAEEIMIDDWAKLEAWRTDLAGRKLKADEFNAFARRLGHLILPAYARGLYKRSLDILEKEEDTGLRVRLRLPSTLAFLPWEYAMVELHGEGSLAQDCWGLDFRISIVRHEAIDRPAAPFHSSDTRRVIFAMASPEPYGKYPALNLAEEQNAIREQLKNVHGVKPEYHPDFQKDKNKKGITQDEIHDLLQTPADIFYFSGHGVFHKDKGARLGQGAIILSDRHNHAKALQADILSGLLAEGHIRLVILDACETGERDRFQQWSCVATALLKGGIPAVVAMQFSVFDDLTKEFSKSLYRYLVAGLNIDEAVTQGRLAVFRADPKQRDWGAPVLYMRNAGGNIFPAVTNERIRIEAERISEQDSTLSKVLLGWTRKDILASPAQLEILEQGMDTRNFTPTDAVMLLRSAVEHDRYNSGWVEVLRKVGTDWLGHVQGRGPVLETTKLDLSEKRLGLDAEILNPAPPGVGHLTWAAVSHVKVKTAQTAALALLALDPENAIEQIQKALKIGISHIGLRRRQRGMLLGTMAEADSAIAGTLSANIDNLQDRLAVWWWRVRKHASSDRDRIRRWCLGGAFGGALALAVMRGFLAVFNSQPVGSEFAVNSYWGFIIGLLLVLGVVMAGPLLLQDPAAPDLEHQGRVSRLSVILGGLGFSLANGLVAWMTGLGLSLATIARFLLTTFVSGMVLSLGLFKQPGAGWRLGAVGWLKRLALVAVLLACLQAPVVAEALTRPGGGYWLDNAQWTVSAVTESSQSIVNKYSFYPVLRSIFNQCIPVESGTCCFNCANPDNQSQLVGFLQNCLAQWWSILDAALVGMVLTLGITAGMHFWSTGLYRLWLKLSVRLRNR